MDRILLVEDDRAMAAMISEYLGLEGFQVHAVYDGAAPVAERPAGYDLIVLDVMLPNRSGFDVLKALRRGYATPVILLTARDNETDCVSPRAFERSSKMVLWPSFVALCLFSMLYLSMRSRLSGASLRVANLRVT